MNAFSFIILHFSILDGPNWIFTVYFIVKLSIDNILSSYRDLYPVQADINFYLFFVYSAADENVHV